PKELAESLMRLAGLDFSELNRERDSLFSERTEVGREQTRLAGQLSGLAFYEDAPLEEESSQSLLADIEKAQGLLAGHRANATRLGALIAQAESSDGEAAEIEREIA